MIFAKLIEILRSAIQYLFEIDVSLPLFGVLLFHHGEQSPFLCHQPMALCKVAGKGKWFRHESQKQQHENEQNGRHRPVEVRDELV